jgi:hypothetical protein
MTQIKWSVSLSDGQTIYEGKGDYEEVKGELSPWQKLMKHLEKQGLEITSLSLYNGPMRWNLPSAGRNPKFKRFEEAEKPLSYNFFRIAGTDTDGGNRDFFTVIEAIYKDKKLQVWVNDETHISWSVIL